MKHMIRASIADKGIATWWNGEPDEIVLAGEGEATDGVLVSEEDGCWCIYECKGYDVLDEIASFEEFYDAVSESEKYMKHLGYKVDEKSLDRAMRRAGLIY